ncbi:MAG: InlB B-repeat-containing protein, partial [Spirochaetales bacterium]|nr:InlB B-repeat-containing protein [Spirochaetales bacterium]
MGEKDWKRKFTVICITLVSIFVVFGCNLFNPNEFEQTSDIAIRASIRNGKSIPAIEHSSFLLTITGEKMEAIEHSFTSESITVSVPAGPSRVFVLEALDDEGTVVYRGESEPIDLEGGKNTDVEIILHQLEFIVEFKAEGGSSPNPEYKQVTFDKEYGKLADTSRTGYVFNGWWTEPSGGERVTAETIVSITNDQTLYARWTAETDTAYTVEHYLEDLGGGGYSLEETESLSGETDTEVTADAENYAGFSYDAGTSEASGTIAADGSLVLKLYYERNSYTLDFVSNGDSEVDPITQDYGSTVTAPEDPEREGYSFTGWDPAVPATMPSADSELTAKWSPDTYTVTLDRGAGSGGNGSVMATFDAEMPSAAAPTHTGYTFGGYYTEENGGGTRYYTSDMSSARNWDQASGDTLYAKWIAESDTEYKV